MKKILLGSMLLFITISLAACSGLTALSSAFEFSSDEQVFSFSAISTSVLLSANETQPLSTATQLTTTLSTETPDLTIDQVEPYLEMFETLLAENNGLNVVTTVSDNPLYETKTEFTVYDLLNNPMLYTMYYNTVLLPSDDVTEPTDEAETQYEINGILLIGTVEYQITGRKEIEDGEEKISFKSYLDENNYVLSQYKIEGNEKKFSLKVVENGIVITESKVKVESEDGETSIKLEYTQGTNYSEYKFKYEVENGINVLKIKYQTLIDGTETSGKISVQVIVDELTNVTSYQLYVEPDHEDAYEHESERSSQHDDGDDSDDADDESETDDTTDQQDQTQDSLSDEVSGATTN